MRKMVVCSVALALGLGLFATAAACRAGDSPASTKADDGKIFELRTYITNTGKLEALHKRFRDVTLRMFKKHGIEVIGFWTPTEGPEAENTLVYMVAFPSEEAMKKAWKDFGNDPEWKKAFAESHKDGVIVKKVISQKLKAVDYSPIK
jgi:hypothetical protein